MSKRYFVDPKKYSQLALRKTVKRTLLFILIASLLFILMIIISGGYINQLEPQSWWPLIILPFFIIHTFLQQKRKAALLEFRLGSDKLEKLIHIKRLDFADQIRAQKSVIKHKKSYHSIILFKDIKNLVITKNTLKVKGKNYNMFTRTGMISIPKEVENYAEIVMFFRSLIEG